MRVPGQDGEPVHRPGGAIQFASRRPRRATGRTGRCARPYRVGVAVDQQDRGGDPRDVRRPVVVLPEQVAGLVEQHGQSAPGARPGRRSGTWGTASAARPAGTHLVHPGQALRYQPSRWHGWETRTSRRTSCGCWIAVRSAVRRRRSSHHVGLGQAEMPDEAGDVIGQGLEAQRPVSIRGVTMSLQSTVITRRSLASSGRIGAYISPMPRPRAARSAAVRAVLLVVQLDAVHVRVAHRLGLPVPVLSLSGGPQHMPHSR